MWPPLLITTTGGGGGGGIHTLFKKSTQLRPGTRPRSDVHQKIFKSSSLYSSCTGRRTIHRSTTCTGTRDSTDAPFLLCMAPPHDHPLPSSTDFTPSTPRAGPLLSSSNVSNYLLVQICVALAHSAAILDRLIQMSNSSSSTTTTGAAGAATSYVTPSPLPTLQSYTALLTSFSNSNVTNLTTSIPSSSSTTASSTLGGHWLCCQSSTESPCPCLIWLETPPGGKALCPANRLGQWVSVKSLNTLRRSNPSQVSELWFGKAVFHFDHFTHLLSLKTLLLSAFLDSERALPVGVLGLTSAMVVFSLPAIWEGLMTLTTSPQIWRLYFLWSRLLYAPLPLKILAAKLGLIGVKISLEGLVNCIRKQLIEVESAWIDHDLPISVDSPCETF